jgi:hypothetical protein
VACAVRKAIEIGDPETKNVEDKTVLSFGHTLPDGRRLRPDLTFESAKIAGREKKVVITHHRVEISTPCSYEWKNGNGLTGACHKKIAKYQPLIANIHMV